MAKQRRWKIDVEGADDLVQMFDELGLAAEEILDQATKNAAEIVLADAKRKVPVRTGALRASLDIKAEKNKKPTKKVYRVFSKGVRSGGVRYAFAVENGTSKMSARPFLRPALDNNKNQIKDEMNRTIVKALEKVK